MHPQLKQDLLVLAAGGGLLFAMAPPAGLLVGMMVCAVIFENYQTGMYDGKHGQDGEGPGQ
jgi:hypothetical protein